MQRWFFLEDPENAALRMGGDGSDNLDLLEEITEEPPPIDWCFIVRAPDLKTEEVVCLTGDIPELGNWAPEKCVVLKKDSTDSNIWSINVKIPYDKKVYYRYFIGVIVKTNKNVIVRSWETSFHPRKIKVIQKAEKYEPEIFGCYNGSTKVDKGWLIDGIIIQLMICKEPFTLWRPKYQNRKLHIKVTPVSLIKHTLGNKKGKEHKAESSSNNQHDHPQYSYTDVACLHCDDTRFETQDQFGHAFENGELLIFHCFMLNPANTALLIDIYVYSSKAIDEEPPYHAGFSYILPGIFKNSTDNIILPLTTTKHMPLGELQLEYAVIRSLKSFKCDMHLTFARHWKKNKKGLNIGHRGSGSSFKSIIEDSAPIRENTIASLKAAINHGADYVEFDVQLSKDLVPVIYHDYHVCIAMKKKRTLTDTDMLEVPIKELTLVQLRMLKLYHLMESKQKNPRFFDEDLEEHQPFPTLKSAFEMLDPKCGFNIEIKWTNKYMDGTYELNDPIDINLYVDTILEVVLKEAGDRHVLFSCFNPNVCTLLRFKQNKYPVIFLTQGETTRYPILDDPRCWSFQAAISFSNMIETLGVCAHTEDILRDPTLVQQGLNAGLVLFCWGDDIADANTIQYLKELGLHGIIYDKICQYMEKKDKENIYLVDARDSQKDLIRLVAQSTEVVCAPIVPSASAIAQTAGELARAKMDDECCDANFSTATSLASLETDGGTEQLET